MNDLIRPHDILVTNTKFLNKLRNLLIFMSCLDMESSIRSIIKHVNGIAEVLGLKGCSNLKTLSIYQCCSTYLCEILHWVIF